MKSILVVDDMAVFREPIAASLRLEGYETQFAADGEEALRLTQATHPDLILLDLAMPKMDGITFLKHLRSEPSIASTHVILLTMSAEKDRVLSAGFLGVKEYILKSRFRLSDLLERVKKFDVPAASPAGQAGSPAFHTSSKRSVTDAPKAKIAVEAPRLLSRDQFLERIKHVFQAKTLSGVIAEVIAMASSPRGDRAQLAALISRDPILSARVLQAANTAIYASAKAPVTTIPDAIHKVGYTTVRNIAAALGVFQCMPETGTDGFNPIRCWQHSFAVAQLCERFVSEYFADRSGLAYVVGLCHDLGDIFIRTQFGKEYQQVIEAATQTGQSREQLHGQMLGITPAQMISAVLKCMGLPDAIRQPIEIFHSPKGPQSTDPLVRILWMAENYANAAMLASSPNSQIAPLTQSFCYAATGVPNPSRPDPRFLRSEVLSLTVALARLSRADEAKLLAPMFKSQSAKLWVARDPSISEFDPVALALESLTKTTVEKRLPTDQEMADICGLLVVASSANAAGFSNRDIEAALNNVRGAGRMLPVLAISCSGAPADHQVNGISWRASATLSELAMFVNTLENGAPGRAEL